MQSLLDSLRKDLDLMTAHEAYMRELFNAARRDHLRAKKNLKNTLHAVQVLETEMEQK